MKIGFNNLQPSWDEGTEGCASILICGCFGLFVTYYDEPLLYSLNEDVMERTAYDSSNLANYTTVVSVSFCLLIFLSSRTFR